MTDSETTPADPTQPDGATPATGPAVVCSGRRPAAATALATALDSVPATAPATAIAPASALATV